MTKISIIVPVFNAEKSLSKCLESLINQTLADIEIIIINDGSTDKTQMIINKYLKKDKRIKTYLIKNAGLGNARNQGIKHSTGEYISFVDGDDYIEIDMLEKLYVKAVEENSDIVECDFYWIFPNKIRLDKADYYDNKDKIMTNIRVMVCNKIFRSDLVKSNNIFFPIGLKYEDIVFTYSILPYAKKLSYMPIGMYYYVQSDSSLINHQTEKVRDIFCIFDELIDFYKKNKLYRKYFDELEYLVVKILLGSSFARILGLDDNALRKRIIKENWLYLNSTFPNWRSNKHLRKIKQPKNTFYAYFTNYMTYNLVAIAYRLKRRLLKWKRLVREIGYMHLFY